MPSITLHQIAFGIQHTISFIGMLIILSGILLALFQYVYFFMHQGAVKHITINSIRLKLTRILILGLEFIVAADVIGTTTAPDYYSIGIVACIVLIRTVLSFSLNREIVTLSKEPELS